MRLVTKTNFLFLTALLFEVSCKSHKIAIPFPEEMERPQPVTMALHFTEPTPLNWPEGKPANPVVKKFSFNKLPSKPFDGSRVVPFSKPPEVVPFDFDKLPDTVFNFDQLPSTTLKYEISVLPPPQIIRTSLHVKSRKSNLIYELGEPIRNNTVSGLFKDRKGFLWISSNAGLYRYDGENLARYLPQQIDSASSMIEDNKDQLWIATVNGIYVLNFRAGILKHLSVKEGLMGNYTIKILLDNHDKIWATSLSMSDPVKSGISIIDESSNTIKQFGTAQGLSNFLAVSIMQDNLENIWITTVFGGVNVIDLKNRKLRYLRKDSGLTGDSVWAIAQDAKSRIWIADISGKLNMIDKNKKRIAHYGMAQGLKKAPVYQLFTQENDNIWLATSGLFLGNPGGVEIINPEKELYKNLSEDGDAINSNSVFALQKDDRQQLWIGTFRGLNMLYPNGHTIEHIDIEDVTSLANDRQGRIWVGLWPGPGKAGIEIIDSATRSIKHLTTAYGLCNDTVQNIRLTEGKICITTNGGIDILDSNFTTITHLGKQQGLTSQNTNAFTKDDRGMFWISSSNSIQGMDVYNPEKRTVQHLGAEEGIKDSLVIDVVQDKRRNIWFTTYTGVIGIIDSTYKTVRYLKNMPGFREPAYKPLLADDRGNVWIGTSKGVYVVSKRLDSITSITTREGLINDNITSLNGYKGRIYAGSKGGLTIIMPPVVSSERKWEFESFGNEQGFGKVVGSAESDMITSGGSFLWGDAGITSLDNRPQPIVSPKTEITGINIFNRPLYFSNEPWKSLHEKDTLREIDPDTFYVKGQLPSNTLFLKQRHIQYDSVDGVYNMPVNLSLPHDQNFLQFHFAQVLGNNEDTTWYRYMLEGADEKWSSRTFIPESNNYYALAPGSYTFKVASLSNGKWTKPAEFSFVILSPWWETWRFRMLSVIALVVVIYAIVKERSRKLKAENLLLEKKVTERTAALKKSLEELKATQAQLIHSEKMASLGELTAGIAHEIQNPLNFVNNFSEVNSELIEELQGERSKVRSERDDVLEGEIINDIKQNLEKINHHGKRADAIVKGMLQHSKTSTGIKEPTDINKLADEYLRLAYHGMRAKDKEFNAEIKTEFDESIGKINVVQQDIGRVLLNLFNNAFYAVNDRSKAEGERQKALNPTPSTVHLNYQPTVLLTTKRNGSPSGAGGIEIRVNDNGNGIPPNIVDKIFQPFFTTKPTGQGTGLGLSLAYDIIKAHGGEIKVESKEGEGSEFIVLLPAKSKYMY